MGDNTRIGWTDATWNPVSGCTKVSPGCDHCYAEAITKRFKHGDFTDVQIRRDRMWQPFHWRRPRMIFTCSMSDLFHPRVPFDYIHSVFAVMASCPQHIFQVLTKRPGRMAHFANVYHPLAWGTTWGSKWPENVWAGTSVENQKYAARLDVLARVPAKVRFVSAEPLLGSLDLKPWLTCFCGYPIDAHWPDAYLKATHPPDHEPSTLSWVIAGGESGAHSRLMERDWVRDLRDQCQGAGVPFFFKQASGLRPGQDRVLDGRTWEEIPSDRNLIGGRRERGELID